MPAKRFFWLWLTGVLGLLTFTALVNFVVDPYGIYGWVNIAGFNEDKTQAVAQSRLVKHYLIERVQPATVLIGSSRIEAGLDPESDVWPQSLRPVFNLGAAGTAPYSQLRLLQDALAATHPKLVVIGTDFIEALTSGADVSSPRRGSLPFEKRLRVTRSGAPNGDMSLARLQDAGSTLLSLSALGDSVATLFRQRTFKHSKLTPLGLNTVTEFGHLVQTEGEHSLFVAKDREKVAQVVPAPPPQFDIEPIGQAVSAARERGAQAIVVITPGHADELEIYRQAGIMEVYEAWRQRLTEIVATAGDNKVALWDFANLTPYTTETVPERGDTVTQLSWFWETNHFKLELGNLIIARILGGDDPHGFGDQLTLATLPQFQGELRKQQCRYVETHPTGVARISRLIAERLGRVCRDNPSRCLLARAQISNASLKDNDLIDANNSLDQRERCQ